MANANIPSGMRPVKQGNGSPWTGPLTIYYVSADDNTALYIGDPVILDGSGDAAGVPSVIRATGATSARITGSVVGFGVSPSLIANGAVRPASTAGYVLVADGVGVIYEAQEDSAGGALAVTNIGQNANLIAGTGNTVQGSGFQIDSSTAGTTNTGQVRLLGLSQVADNAVGVNAKWLIRINLPTEAGAASGTGI